MPRSPARLNALATLASVPLSVASSTRSGTTCAAGATPATPMPLSFRDDRARHVRAVAGRVCRSVVAVDEVPAGRHRAALEVLLVERRAAVDDGDLLAGARRARPRLGRVDVRVERAGARGRPEVLKAPQLREERVV